MKWLLNERAALLGQAEQASQRAQHLRKKVQQYEAALQRAQRGLEAAVAHELTLRHRADALRATLEAVEARVHPDCVAPVRPWAGRYGERGALKTFIRYALFAAAPHPIAGAELKRRAIAEFGLVIQTPAEHRSLKKSIESALRALSERDGVVERQCFSHNRSLWRWKSDLDFEQLRQQASEAARHYEPAHAHPCCPEVDGQRVGRRQGRD